MMMALGLFVFDMRTLPYQEFQHKMGWRHPSTPRVGLRPAHQFAGQDDETINLSGTLYPELTNNGRVSLELVRAMGDQGVAWPLIEGTGMVYGFFSVTDMHVTKTVFFQDGAARKIDFNLSLVRVGDDDAHQLGAITSTLKSLL
jgi:hypothetical protein